MTLKSNGFHRLKTAIPPAVVCDFEKFSREKAFAEKRIQFKITKLKKTGWWDWYFKELLRESQTTPTKAYPSQGLIQTLYDFPEYESPTVVKKISSRLINQTVREWLYYLELFNHPARIKCLQAKTAEEFQPPKNKWWHPVFWLSKLSGRALAITELALHIPGSERPRIKRTERFMCGPFVKLGKYARSIFVGSANPDIWGNAIAVASMIQCHCLAGIPRDGFFSDIKRQADFARKVFELLENSPLFVPDARNGGRKDTAVLLEHWRHNVMGVLEANPEKALPRARALYAAGVRTFRIYSPEPGDGPLRTLEALVALSRERRWQEIEIFAGQVTSVAQAKQLEAAGATGIYIGIGGGGRCTTGVRSNSAIDWPQLVWDLRGQIHIPIIVEGGASDNIGAALALGVTGIGVTRSVGGGTLESPGGWHYFKDKKDPTKNGKNLFKYYRGEASAGMKSMGGRHGPFDIIPYVEGESTKVYMEHGRGDVPSILQRLFLLTGDSVLNLVFQSVKTIEELQDQGAHQLRLVSDAERQVRHTH